MIIFLTTCSVVLVVIAICAVCVILAQWRRRSERNYQRFAHAYAQARIAQLEARQAGDRA